MLKVEGHTNLPSLRCLTQGTTINFVEMLRMSMMNLKRRPSFFPPSLVTQAADSPMHHRVITLLRFLPIHFHRRNQQVIEAAIELDALQTLLLGAKFGQTHRFRL